jgi:hypothetical protein
MVWSAVRSREGALTVLTIAGVFGVIQSATPNIIGIDGYYHIRVAALMREHGPRLDFPWLQLTILSPERYADHHFLFHAFQAPFTFGDPRTGAKMAAVMFATLGLYISYSFLARSGVRFPVFWVVAMLAASPTFLWRQSMARPQGLFLALMVLATWATISGRYWLLVPMGWAAVWLFDGFPFILAMPCSAVCATFGLWIVSRHSPSLREDWADRVKDHVRPAMLGVGAASLGVILGLVTHPYFPRHLEFALLHLLPKAQVGIDLDVRVGGEWYPFPLRSFPSRLGPSFVMCALGLMTLLLQLRQRRLPDWRVVTLGGLALGFLVMTVRSQRIVEYLPPFAAMFCAWGLTRDTIPTPDGWIARARTARNVLGPAVCLVVAAGLIWNINAARINARGAYDWEEPRGAAAWLMTHTPPGSRVYFPAFDDFPRLFYWDTHNTYLVGLDPTYMTLYDPELFSLWRQVAQGRAATPSDAIKNSFGASYVYTERRRPEFVKSITEDPGLETVYSNGSTLVMRVRQSS